MPGRILVVDDTASNRMILRAKLSKAYYDVILAESGEQALDMARHEQPDLILLDVMMPGIGGHEVCGILKSDNDLRHIPVVMVTGHNSTSEKIRGLEAGADDFLTKPVNDLALFARVRNLMRTKVMFDELRLRDSTSRELGLGDLLDDVSSGLPESGSVMLVPPDPRTGQDWAEALRSGNAITVSQCLSEREAASLARLDQPDVVIVHHPIAGGGDGLRLVSALRARTETRQSAIILVVGEDDLADAAQGLELGASDYVIAPFDMAEMSARLQSQLRRKKLSDRLRSNLRDGLRMAVIDPLTGLFNRRYAARHMDGIIERARETGQPFAVMVMDLDRFKAVNDTWGHDAGDAILSEFARRLKENVRGVDLVARMGGEEFLLVMPDTSPLAAAQAAERVRLAIESQPFAVRGDVMPLSVTVSIGAALGGPGPADAAALLREADAALYAAKRGGRNRVSFAPLQAA